MRKGFPSRYFPASSVRLIPTARSWCTAGLIASGACRRGSRRWATSRVTRQSPSHYSKFSILDGATNVNLRGTPDGILVMNDGSHLIVDYKTAKFTMHQDELFPMYEVQLNAYAMIGEQKALSPVSGLALIYTEPVTDDDCARRDDYQNEKGFLMEFSAHIRPVDLKPETIPPLVARVRDIYELNRPPDSETGCKNCLLLQGLIDLARP